VRKIEIAPIRTLRLSLEALTVNHAVEAAVTFADPALHEFIGSRPLSASELASRYAKLVRGPDPEKFEFWLNWMVLDHRVGALVGTVQATVNLQPSESSSAQLAWVVGTKYQGNGYAKEAAAGMAQWLYATGIGRLDAYINPDHLASEAVARAIGLRPTDIFEEGERLWSSRTPT
jgi:RimJ/RimL family protein N-acetyltransferase